MTPYLLSFTFYFIFVCVGIRQKKLRSWLLFASIPVVGLALLRGMVGVDTAFYHQAVDLIRDQDSLILRFEPLFEVVILYFSRLMESSLLVLVVIASITTLLLFIGEYKIEDQPYLLALGIIPYIYMDMTMNGIRYGLAYSLILCAAYFYICGSKIIFYLVAVAAALVQVSSALLAIMFIVFIDSRWRALLFGALFSTSALIFFGDYIQLKIEDNASLITQSSSAGLAPLLLSALTLITFWSELKLRSVARFQLISLVISSIGFFAITQFYYFGLRLQLLNLFLIYLVGACILSRQNIRLGGKQVMTLFLIGILAAGFRLKNFSNDAGVGDSPFAPYHFFWELK